MCSLDYHCHCCHLPRPWRPCSCLCTSTWPSRAPPLPVWTTFGTSGRGKASCVLRSSGTPVRCFSRLPPHTHTHWEGSTKAQSKMSSKRLIGSWNAVPRRKERMRDKIKSQFWRVVLCSITMWWDRDMSTHAWESLLANELRGRRWKRKSEGGGSCWAVGGGKKVRWGRGGDMWGYESLCSNRWDVRIMVTLSLI